MSSKSKNTKKAVRRQKKIAGIEHSRNAVALCALTRSTAGSMKDSRLKRKRTRKAKKQAELDSFND